MSDHVLRYVPCDSTYRPGNDRARAASYWLEHTVGGRASVRSLPQIEFVDAGQNWEGVRCSACGADAEPWWSEAVSEAADAGFASLDVRALCCGASVSLNSLNYGWQVAFGSFVLEIANPVRPGLSEAELQALGEQLGCQVTEIRVRV